MKRRDVLVGLGGSVAVWPLSALAQSQPVPVIGFLNSASPGPFAAFAHAFREGLREAGFVDGNNVTIEARWAEGHYERLPNLAADLVGRRVTLIVATGGLMSARAAKAATTTLPVVFLIGIDPVKMGLVSSLNHPGGNATGISLHTTAILEKRLELLRELVPSAHTIGLLVNPNTEGAQVEIGDIEQVAGARGLQLLVLRATSDTDFEFAFAAAAVQRADALLVSADPFFQPARAAHRPGSAALASDRVSLARIRRRGRVDQLWAQYSVGVSPDGPICRPDAQRHAAEQHSGRAPHQI